MTLDDREVTVRFKDLPSRLTAGLGSSKGAPGVWLRLAAASADRAEGAQHPRTGFLRWLADQMDEQLLAEETPEKTAGDVIVRVNVTQIAREYSSHQRATLASPGPWTEKDVVHMMLTSASSSARLAAEQMFPQLPVPPPVLPDEPKGVGAVYRDPQGRIWVRLASDDSLPWCNRKADRTRSTWNTWDAMTAGGEVLSQGLVIDTVEEDET